MSLLFNIKQNNVLKHTIFFWLCIAFTFGSIITTAIIDIVVSNQYIDCNNASADLSETNFNSSFPVHLEGEWEFFWDKYIVTDNLENAKPDMLIKVPSLWSDNELNGTKLPINGHASYRITLKNPPQNINITAFIPNVNATYRVFINGKKVLSLIEMHPEQTYFYLPEEPIPNNSVLVIEVLSRYSNGLYVSPVLSANANFTFYNALRSFIASAFLGIAIMFLLAYSIGYILRDKHFSAFLVLFVNILLALVVFSKDDFFDILRLSLPMQSYYQFTIFLYSCLALVPCILAFYTCSIKLISLSSKVRKMLLIYSCIMFTAVLVFGIIGYIRARGFAILLSCLSMLFVFIQLYKSVRHCKQHSVIISAIIAAATSCIIYEALLLSGFLKTPMPLASPSFFMIFILFQAILYLKRNIAEQENALQAAMLQVKLKENEASLLLSQIKPHFMYNALVAIQVLCIQEPETAAMAIEQFSNYLRANMRSITTHEPISFAQELVHIKSYTAIEKLRFQNRLNIVYDTDFVDFYVPPLTIQPLVENAIIHGACKNVRGGTVHISSYEDDKFYLVKIADDGRGATIEAFLQNKEPHGLLNVRLRLERMMNAALEISTAPTTGTVVLVKIPKGR